MLTKLKHTYAYTRLNDEPYPEFKNLTADKLGRDKELSNFLTSNSGLSFGDGLYRIHTLGSSLFWTAIIENCFSQYKDQVYCFGFDWLGRQYAKGLGTDILYMFDSATFKAFHLKISLESFHNVEMINHPNETLNYDTFSQWMDVYGCPLQFMESVGFITPLFLGGEDIFENYEIVETEADWEISFQLYNQIKGLPEGTLIDKIKFKK